MVRVRAILLVALIACSALTTPHTGAAALPNISAAIGTLSGAPAGGSAAPMSATNPGHVDSVLFARATVYGTFAIADDIAFTTDSVAGAYINVTGGAVHDQWNWRGYWPGGSYAVVDCYARIAAPGDSGNTSGTTALLSNCNSSGTVFVSRTFPAGCPCDFGYGAGASIATTPARQHVGTWGLFVDYADHDGSTIPSLVSLPFDLQVAPLVAVLHGWESTCEQTMQDVVYNLQHTLLVPPELVQCHNYESRDGVKPAACGRSVNDFGPFIRTMRAADPDQPNVVHIVAHSMGGLVARYYAEQCRGADDPNVATISMLGTPNEGVLIAGLLRQVCSWHALFSPALLFGCVAINIGGRLNHVDLHSDAIGDLSPGSGVIKKLDSTSLPAAIFYRAHIGRVDTSVGFITSGDRNNDCFIAENSVEGKGSEFGASAERYGDLSHAVIDIPGCGGSTLIGDPRPIQRIAADIKAWPSGVGAASPPLIGAAAVAPPLGSPLLAVATGIAMPGADDTHVLTVPAGLSDATIGVFWGDADTPPDLGFTLKRPDGSTVTAGDPGVSGDLALDGASSFSVRSHGFAITSPASGDWAATVTGTSVPAEGAPYVVLVMPASGVAVDATVDQPLIAQGTPQVVTAEFDDNGTAVTPSEITGSVIVLDGTSQPLTLHDDGLGGDATAGDRVYSASIDTTGGCGTYRVQVTATGATSEGTVTRTQLATYDVSVPGDAVRDPCNPDDDADALTDADELGVYRTDPLDPDTDGDGLDDGAEIAAGTDPFVTDTDADLLTDGAEVNTYGSNPLVVDTDADGCADGEEAGSNASRGGLRDPVYYWDFYDVGRSRGATSAPGDEDFTKDGKVNLTDQLIILDHFGHNARDAHDHDLDRLIPDAMKLWRTAENPSGDTVDFTDVLNNQKSFGHDCTAPP